MSFPVDDSKKDFSQELTARALSELLVRYGAPGGEDLDETVTQAIAQLETALTQTSDDGESLSALDVTRIRLGKLAAFLLPPALFRDPPKLAALRAELHTLALSHLGERGAAINRFAKGR